MEDQLFESGMISIGGGGGEEVPEPEPAPFSSPFAPPPLLPLWFKVVPFINAVFTSFNLFVNCVFDGSS